MGTCGAQECTDCCVCWEDPRSSVEESIHYISHLYMMISGYQIIYGYYSVTAREAAEELLHQNKPIWYAAGLC